MEVKYKNVKVKEKLTNLKELKKDYPVEICNKLIDIIKRFEAANNLNVVIMLNRSLQIKKLSGSYEDIWSARINDKYRLHFKVNKHTSIVEIIEITILEIDKHQRY